MPATASGPNEPIPMAPPALVDALRIIAEPPEESEADRRLFEADVVRELGRIEQRRASLFRVQRMVAAIAAVAIFVAIARSTSARFARPAPAPATPRRSDLDGDGHIDVRDMLLLSSAMRAGVARPDSSTGRAWDVNADGVVDDADLDALARIITRAKVVDAQQRPEGRIATLTIGVDTAGRPLAATQVRLRPRVAARVMGIEPGDQFSRVWFDGDALGAELQGPLVLAAIRETGVDGGVTLARIGVWVDPEVGDEKRQEGAADAELMPPGLFGIEIDAAVGPDGERIDAVLRLAVDWW